MSDQHEREDAHEAAGERGGDMSAPPHAREAGEVVLEVSNDNAPNAPIDELEDAITQRTVRLDAEPAPECLD